MQTVLDCPVLNHSVSSLTKDELIGAFNDLVRVRSWQSSSLLLLVKEYRSRTGGALPPVSILTDDELSEALGDAHKLELGGFLGQIFIQEYKKRHAAPPKPLLVGREGERMWE